MDLLRFTRIVANILILYATFCSGDKPHIIFINGDDLGWFDVGWHNDKVKTPVLNGLVAEGVELDRLYTAPLCTPSRASLLTGMYAFNTGLQREVLYPGSPYCAPTDLPMIQELLPQEYRRVSIGKWHVGYCNEMCTPEYRGFDKFYGYYNGGVDHYSHEMYGGFDWYNGTTPEWETRGQYSTDLLKDAALREIGNFHVESGQRLFMVLSWAAVHWPIQAPAACRDIYPPSVQEPRRTLLGMVTCMDTAIGEIIQALKRKNMWDNTVFAFLSDNGGEAGGSSNYPLSGAKATMWEGGVRIPAFVYSRLFKKTGYKHEGYMHQADWLPTLLSMTGTDIPTHIDGIDQSDMLIHGYPSSRRTVPITFDPIFPQFYGVGAIIHEDFKLIIGFPGLFSGHGDQNGVGMYQTIYGIDELTKGFAVNFTQPHSPDRTNDCYTEHGQIKQRCTEHYINQVVGEFGNYDMDYTTMERAISALEEAQFVQLFNIKEDPREMKNLARDPAYSDILRELKEMAEGYIKTSRPAVDPANVVPESQAQKDGAWATGFCDMSPSEYYKRKLNTGDDIESTNYAREQKNEL